MWVRVAGVQQMGKIRDQNGLHVVLQHEGDKDG